MPVIWITLTFFGGVLAADRLSGSPLCWIGSGLAASLVVAWVCWIGRRSQRLENMPAGLLISLAAAFFLGGARYQAGLPRFSDPAYILNHLQDGARIEITGLIVEYPDAREQIINLILEVETLESASDGTESAVQGRLLAKVPAEMSAAYGDRVRLCGYLSLPPEGEDFNYRNYLKRRGVYVYLPNAELEIIQEAAGGNPLLRAIYHLRTWALERVYLLWPDPEASLLAGILLGIEAGISDQVQQAFRETGTTHIIAISGFNITIVAGLFSRFFSRVLNPRQGALAALVGIALYTVLVGSDAAVLRAAVMGGLSIFAQQIGRRQHGLNAAALASLIMILFDPQLPWDISFQLSLSATLGLILYADPLAGWFLRFSSRVLPLDRAQRLVGPVSEYILFTFAAQLTTLPVMLYHFQSFSLNTFLTNPAILPVQPPIMLAGGLALILSVIWFPLGKAAAPLVYPLVLYTIRVVEAFSSLPIRPMHFGPITPGWLLVFYILLGLFTFAGPLLAQFGSEVKTGSVLGVLALAVLMVWRMAFSAPDGLLHFVLYNVGTGSAIYLQSPTGQRVLINGGPSSRLLSDHLGRQLPPFQRKVEYWIVASPIEQDLDALAANLPRFRPDQVLWLGDRGLCWEAENIRSLLQESGIQVVQGLSGQVLTLDGGVQVRVLSQNRSGGTLLVEYGHFRVLLPFGLSAENRESWREGLDLGEMTGLLLANNGYQSSNPSLWIDNLRPRLIMLSVGLKDSQGLPDRGLLDRLGGYSLLRTDQQGSIQLVTDGTNLWVHVERLP